MAPHDTWLMPETACIPPKTATTLHLTSGEAFPTLEYAIQPERVESAGCQLAEQAIDLARFTVGDTSLQTAVTLPVSGIALCWISLKPRSITLTTAQAAHYLEEIAASAELLRAWAEAEPERRWRETYRKHTKTFLRVGEPHEDIAWRQAVGMALEILPLIDPTSLRVGTLLPVCVVKQGKPLGGFMLSGQGERTEKQWAETNESGVCSFHVTSPGHFLLRGVELRPSSQPEIEWESDATTLTLRINAF